MKLPEYTLKSPVSIPNMQNNDVLEFPAGTLIRPFWNEGFLPEHVKEELDDVRKYTLKRDPLIMCQIGVHWVPVVSTNIRETNW